VRAADVAKTPAELQVVARIAAGRAMDGTLEPGQAAAIMTGAPLPAGADGVVQVEETEEREGIVRVLKANGVTRFVAQKGSDCPKGKLVLPKGTVLGPAQVAVAASVGAADLEVFELPRVAVLGTGDELVPFDAEPGPAQIRNCNNPMLVALLTRLGCTVHDMGTAPDNPDFIRARVLEALTGDYDALFVTGGMSMGEHDYVPKILQEVGVEFRVTKLRIKPGKPFVFGVRKGSGFGVQGSGGEAAAAPSSLNPEPRTPNPSAACFNCMIPLSFVPEQSELGHLPGPTGLTDLKTLAIARLMLDNVPHIKAFWIMQGIGLSQAALSWGCDDLDGTVVWYDITKRAGDAAAPTHQELHVNDIRRLIREAGREPVERDTLYRPVRRDAVTGRVLANEPALSS